MQNKWHALSEEEINEQYPGVRHLQDAVLRRFNVRIVAKFWRSADGQTRWSFDWHGDPEVLEFLTKVYNDAFETISQRDTTLVERARRLDLPDVVMPFPAVDREIWGDLLKYDPTVPPVHG